MESNIIEQVRRIILERSLLYNEIMPDVGNIPIFPDRQEYKVVIQLINTMIWVELLRDEELPIDSFEIKIEKGTVMLIDHYLTPNSDIVVPTSYPRKALAELQISQREFLHYQKQNLRKDKLKKLLK